MLASYFNSCFRIGIEYIDTEAPVERVELTLSPNGRVAAARQVYGWRHLSTICGSCESKTVSFFFPGLVQKFLCHLLFFLLLGIVHSNNFSILTSLYDFSRCLILNKYVRERERETCLWYIYPYVLLYNDIFFSLTFYTYYSSSYFDNRNCGTYTWHLF